MVNLNDENLNKEKVLKAIKKAKPPIVTIDEISLTTKLTRQTVSKYIHILHAEGKIKVFKKVGKINLYEAVKK